MKLTAAQERALGKLTREWKSAYALRESLPTLDSLVRNGVAERKNELGYMTLPRNSFLYRSK